MKAKRQLVDSVCFIVLCTCIYGYVLCIYKGFISGFGVRWAKWSVTNLEGG